MPAQTTLQIRRGTAADWIAQNPILAAAEFGYETDTGKLKIGDGTTTWNSLKYLAAVGSGDPLKYFNDAGAYSVPVGSGSSGSTVSGSLGTRGTAIVTAGQTTAVVTHNLTATPYGVVLTPNTDTLGKRYWVNPKGASTFTVNLDSTAASNIGFDWMANGLTENTGGTGTTDDTSTNYSEYLNVGSGYEYATDGTDDDVQIQEAIDDASAGDIVWIHAGIYDHTYPLDMKSGVTLKGDGVATDTGTVLKVPTSALSVFNQSGETVSLIHVNNKSNVTIYGMRFDGNDQSDDNIGEGWENGIKVYNGGSNFTAHDLYFTKINGDGIRVPGESLHTGGNVYNIQIKRSGHDGLRLQNCKNWKVSNIQCDIYINYGIRYSDATDCELSYSSFTALVGSGSAAVGLDDDCPGLNIHHCRFEDIYGSTFRHGILAASGVGAVTVKNNIFYKCYDGGIRATNGDQSFTVDQNIFDDCDYAVSDLNYAGLTNNIITNCDSYAVRGISGKCTVKNCNIYGGSTTVSNATVSGTLTGAPGYNATSGLYIPLQSSAPLYSVLSGWTTAGYTA